MAHIAPGNEQIKKSGKTPRKFIIPVFTLLIVIAITVFLYLCARDPERIAGLQRYGYPGAFLISLIGNASILLPGVSLSLLTGLGVVLYASAGLVAPIMVGLAGGAGAAIGEIVGYVAGYSGSGVIKNRKLYERLSAWVQRWGTVAIFVFTLIPLFFDLVGIAAGALRYPLWKFVLVCWIGRTLLYVTFVMLAALGWHAVLPFFG